MNIKEKIPPCCGSCFHWEKYNCCSYLFCNYYCEETPVDFFCGEFDDYEPADWLWKQNKAEWEKKKKEREEKMIFFPWNYHELLDQAIDAGVLQGKKDNWVLVYHEASETEPDKYPEGWYQDTYAEAMDSLKKDKSGIKYIADAIRKAGKDIHFSDMSWLYKPMELAEMEWIDYNLIGGKQNG